VLGCFNDTPRRPVLEAVQHGEDGGASGRLQRHLEQRSPGQRWRTVAALVVIEEQSSKMGMEMGGCNEEGKTKTASASRV
jgi:hypothetical protein